MLFKCKVVHLIWTILVLPTSLLFQFPVFRDYCYNVVSDWKVEKLSVIN